MVDGVSEKPERLEEAFGVRGSGRDGTLPGNRAICSDTVAVSLL